ncbi:hypothetical protein NMY22_g12786 [Coprinellus aureogranulatus]|nr:hypothetical protein NMY22_g12786 [Coprinellus aureogranulatus]
MNTIDSPIQHLPEDVLATLFQHCVPYPTRCNPGPPLSCNHPSVILSHVCHTWRDLALSTPLLWSRMHIRGPVPGPYSRVPTEAFCRKVSEVSNAVRVWIDRSVERPLSILLDVPNVGHWVKETAFIKEAYDRIFQKVFQCSKRWKHIDIRFFSQDPTDSSFLQAFRQLLPGRIPILESFAMEINGEEYRQSAVCFFSRELLDPPGVFCGPSLHHVKLVGQWYLNRSLWVIRSGWARLTELHVELDHGEDHSRFSGLHALQLLEALPTLEKASFELQYDSERRLQDYERETTIILPRLSSLSLRGIPPKPAFARSLSLPSLTSLYLVFNIDFDIPSSPPNSSGTPEIMAGVVELVKKFGTRLTTLALDADVLAPSFVHDVLGPVDHERLQRLSLIDRIFRRVIAQPGDRGSNLQT